MHVRPGVLGCCPFVGGGSVVVDLLFGVLPTGCGDSVFVFFCCFFRALRCVLSSLSIILKRKGELVDLLLLPYECLVTVYMFCDSSSRCRGLVCGV